MAMTMYSTRMTKKARKVMRSTSPSLPMALTVAQAATTLLGQIRLPSDPAAFWPAKTVMGLIPSSWDASMSYP